MGKYSEMKFSDMYDLLCKELCCEMEKFESDPNKEILCGIKDLIESIKDLQEIEAGSAMRDFAEDEWGYDMDEGMPPRRYGLSGLTGLYNAGRRGPSRYNGSRGGSNPNTRYGYPSYGPDRGGMYPDRGMPGYADRDRMGGMDRDGRQNGRMGYGDDEPYMLRQENGKPRMTPYAMHTGSIPKKLTEQQCKEWMDSLANSDGTDGPKWTKQQVEAEAKKAGIDVNKTGLQALWSCTNMMYSDYCDVAQKYGVDRPSFFIHLAEAFLNDEDFEGSGEEKLSIYYHTIADHE